MNGRLKKVLWLLLAAVLLVGVAPIQRALNRDRAALGLTRVEPLENAPPVLAFTTVATVTRMGVTTVFVGQDGDSYFPLRDWFAKLQATPPALNVASMVGHATLRQQVMGQDLYRASTPQELARMKELLAKELTAGAFGLSTGLEYEAAHFSTTEEVVELSKIAAASGGFYISHVRDEGNKVFDSYDEILRVGREAKIPVEITHIKLGSTPVWHLAASRMPAYFEQARREGVKLSADVYPYTFWHSTLRVLVTDRDFFNPEKVARALADNAGQIGRRPRNPPTDEPRIDPRPTRAHSGPVTTAGSREKRRCSAVS